MVNVAHNNNYGSTLNALALIVAVVDKTLFNGNDDFLFNLCAQLVTILYRIAGEPESTATNPFADVADGQWYTNAVIWAAENGIVKGVNTTTFAPNDQITREQIATILFRYAKAEKVEGKLAGFPDAEKVSDYAADAMAWAVEQGLINGISESDGKTYLAPQETATRAQIAVILMRYLTAEN